MDKKSYKYMWLAIQASMKKKIERVLIECSFYEFDLKSEFKEILLYLVRIKTDWIRVVPWDLRYYKLLVRSNFNATLDKNHFFYNLIQTSCDLILCHLTIFFQKGLLKPKLFLYKRLANGGLVGDHF